MSLSTSPFLPGVPAVLQLVLLLALGLSGVHMLSLTLKRTFWAPQSDEILPAWVSPTQSWLCVGIRHEGRVTVLLNLS